MWEFLTKLENFGDSSNLLGGHFVVDDIVVQKIKSKNTKRLICTLNKQEKIHCALQSMGNGTYFVMVNKTLQKKLNVLNGESIGVTLEVDKSKYGIPMPEEMAEILSQDENINQLFHLLTPGKQRSLLYQIGIPKTTESRIKKAILITRYLSEMKGKIDFREMNEYLKTNGKLI
jgi:hypothetical protein